ncbi:hypothetical protein [Actinoplanes sp. NPDC023714]|uniref:DUF4760 domain-containing protein n=1 Tax=Actinoplanes sp. NPDC023714 TaxID=3154322 RepID=UPI0033F035E2
MDDIWAAIEAVSTACAAVIVLAGLLYARSQIGEARRTRNASLLLEFKDEYHSPEMRAFRRRLLTGEFGPPSRFDPSLLGEADRYAFWSLVDELELLGVFVEKGLLDFDLVVAAFRSTPLRVWYYIRPWILDDREQRPPGYAFHFEKLAIRYEKQYENRFGVPHEAYERVMRLEPSPGEAVQPGGSIS